jgi:hypothetical protein
MAAPVADNRYSPFLSLSVRHLTYRSDMRLAQMVYWGKKTSAQHFPAIGNVTKRRECRSYYCDIRRYCQRHEAGCS